MDPLREALSSTAIISLVIGINQLSGIVKEYNERDESIHQLVSASKLLINMKDYQAAWGVIQKAVTISSSSQAAFNQQVDVAMAWLRNIWMQKGKKKYSEIIDPFIFTLSQGAGDKDTKRASRILAHIGWANYLRLLDEEDKYYEIDQYLSKALELNSEDTYANLFKGYWLLNKRNEKKDKNKALSDALTHFSVAVQNDENRHFVNMWQIYALTDSKISGADVEAFKIVNQWRKQNFVPVDQTEIKSVLGTLHWVFYDLNYRLPEGSFPIRLTKELPFDQIRDTYLWLLSEGESDKRVSQDLRPINNLGIIAEASGDLESAYNYYVEFLNQAKGSSSGWQQSVTICLCRVLNKCMKNNVSLSEIKFPISHSNTIFLNVDKKLGIDCPRSVGMNIEKIYEGPAKEAGLLVGDIIIMVDNEPVDDITKLDQMKEDIISNKKSHADLFILRGKELLCYRVEKGKI